jgi:hypothetical protein
MNILDDPYNYDNLKAIIKKEHKHLHIKDCNNLFLLQIKKNKKNIPHEYTKFNGLIFEKNTNKLICNMFPVVKEYPDIYNYENLNELTVEESSDGTLIKLFYYDNKWNIATNRCIDAKTSFWISNNSFYDLFMEAASNIKFESLNTTYCYAFILQHPKSRNIVKFEKANIIYIYSYDLINNVEMYDENLSFLDNPKKLQFTDWNQMIDSLSQLDWYSEGYIVYNRNREMTKLINPKFNELKLLKGNNVNMFYRCIVIYKYGKMDEFLVHFPEYAEQFNYLRSFIYNLSNNIYNLYVAKHIKKQQIAVVDININLILTHLYKDYEKSIENSQYKITITKKYISEKIMKYSPLRIYNIIESYK